MTHQVARAHRLLFALALLGCSVQPRPVLEARDYTLLTGGCRSVDQGLIDHAIALGYQTASVNEPSASGVSLAGLTIVGEVDPRVNGEVIYGSYQPYSDTLVFRCGEEWVIAHETGHRIAWKLGASCWNAVWHGVAYANGMVNMRCLVVSEIPGGGLRNPYYVKKGFGNG